MEQISKDRFDAVFQLYSHAWQQFNTRRVYEWQICLALWTALALAIAGVLNVTTLPKIPGGILTPMIILLITVALQFHFVSGTVMAHKHDRQMAIHYRKILHKISDSSFDICLETDLEKGRLNWGKALNWSSIFQLGITLLLSILFTIVMYAKLNNKEDPENKIEIKTSLNKVELRITPEIEGKKSSEKQNP